MREVTIIWHVQHMRAEVEAEAICDHSSMIALREIVVVLPSFSCWDALECGCDGKLVIGVGDGS